MKQFLKLHKNHFLVAIVSVSVASVLGSFINRKSESVNTEVINDNSTEVYVVSNNINNSYIGQEKADEYVDKYFKQINSEDSNSDSKIKKYIDFVFNGEQLGGYTFDDLTDMGKENVINNLNDLDDYVEEYVPNYKERFKTWLSSKEEKLEDILVDGGVKVKEKWNEYKDRVNEKYESKVK